MLKQFLVFLISQVSDIENKKYDSIINALPNISRPGKSHLHIYMASSIIMLLLQISEDHILL